MKANVPYVQYQTMGDNRVRNEHAVLNGKVFSLHDDNVGKIFPPNAWGCRCEMVAYPYTPAKTDTADSMIQSANIKDAFAQNRAVAGKVFEINQYYIENNIDKALKLLNDITYKHYGLDDQPKSSVKLKLNDSITLDEVVRYYQERKDAKSNNMVFVDHYGRMLTLDENQFLIHTGAKKSNKQEQYLSEKRYVLFEKIQEVLNDPTETYLKYFGKNPSIKYIKYYEDGSSIIVQGGVNDDGTMNVDSWFMNDNRQEQRKGWLIK